MLELYKNIRNIRLEKKMTQDELAKLTGYTDRSSIAKIERGDVDLPQSKIMLFASALGVDAGTLMGNTGIQDPGITLRPDESALLHHYNELNDTGKEQAQLRVMELTQIPAYQIKGDAEPKSYSSDVG